MDGVSLGCVEGCSLGIEEGWAEMDGVSLGCPLG